MCSWTPITLYTGAGRDEDRLLDVIHRLPFVSRADGAYLAGSRARWYNESTGHWSADWSAYVMAKTKKPVPAREAIRRPSPSEQRAINKKKLLAGKDPTKEELYPMTNAVARKWLKGGTAAQKKEAARWFEAQAAIKAEKEGKEAPKPAVPLDDVEDLQDCLPERVEEFRQLKAERAVIDARLDELGPEIIALLEAVGQRAVYTDEWQVSRATNVNVQISKEKLVEAGVDPDVITACTVKKETRAFAKVTVRGETEHGAS